MTSADGDTWSRGVEKLTRAPTNLSRPSREKTTRSAFNIGTTRTWTNTSNTEDTNLHSVVVMGTTAVLDVK